jgi:beta-galactosidase
MITKHKSVVKIFLLIVFTFSTWWGCSNTEEKDNRNREKFNYGWKFIQEDVKGAESNNFDDSSWRDLNVPHDWAIEGPFTKDAYYQMGYLPYEGVGWYRKTFELNSPDKKVLIEFDGVMMLPKVWVNGQFVGEWGFGYTSFAFDISEFLNRGEKNVIAVRVENLDYSSRWYPGSGIYRNVWLTVTNPIHIEHWGTFVTTPDVTDEKASLKIETVVLNENSESADVELLTKILDPNGNEIENTNSTEKISANGKNKFIQELEIKNPERWDITSPALYTAVSNVIVDGKIVDSYETPFGIRTFKFDANEGFFLNGRNLKIQGVNMHHDLGPLGAAVNYRATERQLEILKEMGVNAIRTAHNPPSPEQLDLCDKMGILVMDESFDEWRRTKLNVKNSYSILFDEWAEKDMAALVKRDRNHPSIILWSTGNEVPELGTGKVRVSGGNSDDVMEVHYDQIGHLVKIDGWEAERYGSYDGQVFTPFVKKETINRLAKEKQAPSLSGTTWDVKGFRGENVLFHFDFWDDKDGKNSSKKLADICHKLDPTRPVSSGIHLSIRLDEELLETFDVAGFNYWHKEIEGLHKEYPNKPLLVTEAAAVLSTRGVYQFPVERIYHGFRDKSMQISAYDLINTGFGALPDVEFKLQDDNEWLAGQFVWSGFDYHGEPDPFENMWPAHSSYFGIIDMCGFPKDRFYLYQSQWTEEPMIHLLPHWNWEGREGDVTPIFVYTNCASVELFVNGESKGIKNNGKNIYRLKWEDIVYEPGSIKAVGYDENGKVLVEKEIKTAADPKYIELICDRDKIQADGEDLSFVTVKVTDDQGNSCPTADNLISFKVEGEGKIIAVGNGNPISHESYTANMRKLFNGLCLVIVRSTHNAGSIKLTATSPGVIEKSISINSTKID